RIAAPCSVPWDSMQGDSRKRFCDQCQLHVYNISDMSRPVAEEFLEKIEGRVCINMYKREDGTILTEDCPVGLKAIRRKFRRMMFLVGSVTVSALMGIGLYQKISKNGAQSNFLKKIFNQEPEPPPIKRLAGKIQMCDPSSSKKTTSPSSVSTTTSETEEQTIETTETIESQEK
ncbi:MAG: hypothetical protein AABZ60_16450, partial [Planctomycetota bacterium]